MIYNNVLEAMGHTPMIRLNRMNDENSAQVLVKYEGLNIGGSIKTRTAFNMIEEAEKQGKLTKMCIRDRIRASVFAVKECVKAMRGAPVEAISLSTQGGSTVAVDDRFRQMCIRDRVYALPNHGALWCPPYIPHIHR